MSNSSLLAPSAPPIAFHSFHQQFTISPPLSPVVSPFTTVSTTALPSTAFSGRATFSPLSPPVSPLPWVWQCHVCKARWPLGATRRCLIDGHYYCSGQPQTRKGKSKAKGKRGRGCSSEFDYIGWKDWGRWRRGVRERELDGCGEACDFPSHCRYRKAGVGGPKTAVEADKVLKEKEEGENENEKPESIKIKSLEEILKDAEASENVDKKEEKRSKTRKVKLSPVIEVEATPASSKSTESVKEKEPGSRRAQSTSLGTSSERLHKLKEAAERRLERSRGDSAEANPHKDEKEKGSERRNMDIAIEPGLQPFLLPVIDFFNRKASMRTPEGKP